MMRTNLQTIIIVDKKPKVSTVMEQWEETRSYLYILGFPLGCTQSKIQKSCNCVLKMYFI
jgi:hypothetical protein